MFPFNQPFDCWAAVPQHPKRWFGTQTLNLRLAQLQSNNLVSMLLIGKFWKAFCFCQTVHLLFRFINHYWLQLQQLCKAPAGLLSTAICFPHSSHYSVHMVASQRISGHYFWGGSEGQKLWPIPRLAANPDQVIAKPTQPPVCPQTNYL